MPTLSPHTPILTKAVIGGPGHEGAGWRTTLFNCNCHTTDEVVGQIMKAINCSLGAARSLMNIAHHTGQVKVCEGSREYCERVADVLGAIGLRASATD